MEVVIAAIIIGALLGVGMGVNGRRKRQDRRDANRYLAERYRAERKQRHK